MYDVDPTCDIEDPSKQISEKKIWKLCEGSKKFQNTWTTKLPWAKSMWDKKGEVHHVQCKECTFVEGKQKL